MALLLWSYRYRGLKHHLRFGEIFERDSLRRFFAVNRDIFLRTLCLVAVTVFFTSTGAGYGDVILAVNTLLMQLFTLFSYVMDGFAYAGEALTGKHIGARDTRLLRTTLRQLFRWGAWLAAGFTLVYGLGGEAFLGLLTNEEEVITASGTYFYWALAIPAAGFAAFLLDGICIGATITSVMLKGMAVAAAAFFLLYFSLQPSLGNHALWMAFIVYLILRGAVQGYSVYQRLYRTAKA